MASKESSVRVFQDTHFRIAVFCALAATVLWLAEFSSSRAAFDATAFDAAASDGAVTALGFPLPILCGFRLITGIDCPGCGLTRAVILAADGNYAASYYMHLWGIPVWILLLTQIPYRFFLLFRGKNSILPLSAPMKRWISHFILLSFLLPWLAKTLLWFVLRYC